MNKKSNYKGRKPGSKNKVKKAEPTKTKRIPIAIEDVIDSIIDQHKKRNGTV